MNKLDINLIRTIFRASTFNKGEAYHKNGKVINLQLDSAKNTWRATVSGSKLYTVQIELDDYDIDDNCNCPAHYSYGECKHVCATLMAIAEEQHKVSTGKKSGTENERYRHAEELIEYFGQNSYDTVKVLADEARYLNVEFVLRTYTSKTYYREKNIFEFERFYRFKSKRH